MAKKVKKLIQKDLITKTKPELVKLVEDLWFNLVKTQTDLAAGRLKNVSLLGQQKKQLARLKTALRQKELNENN